MCFSDDASLDVDFGETLHGPTRADSVHEHHRRTSRSHDSLFGWHVFHPQETASREEDQRLDQGEYSSFFATAPKFRVFNNYASKTKSILW